jgi:hypothetical protein
MSQLTTRIVAEWLCRTEPQIADLVRRGKVTPPPTIVAGRRFWTVDQVRQAANHLGLLTPELEARLAASREARP